MFSELQQVGFCTTEPLLSERQCGELLSAIQEHSSNSVHPGTRHLMACGAVSRFAGVTAPLVAQAVGYPGMVPFRATLFAKSSSANWLVAWHQDTALPFNEPFQGAGWGPWSVKGGVHYVKAPAHVLHRVVALRLQLDPGNINAGPLRVIPASHQRGVVPEESIRALVLSVPAATCVVPQGAALLMRPLLVHASSKATSNDPRRVLHVEYTESITIKEGTIAVA